MHKMNCKYTGTMIHNTSTQYALYIILTLISILELYIGMVIKIPLFGTTVYCFTSSTNGRISFCKTKSK